jgi:hypothetical protein
MICSDDSFDRNFGLPQHSYVLLVGRASRIPLEWIFLHDRLHRVRVHLGRRHFFLRPVFSIIHPHNLIIIIMDWLGYFLFGGNGDGASSSSIDPSFHPGGEHRTKFKSILFPGDDDDDEPHGAVAKKKQHRATVMPSSLADDDDDEDDGGSSANARMEDYHQEPSLDEGLEGLEDDEEEEEAAKTEPHGRTTTHPPLLTCRRCCTELHCCRPWFDATEPVNHRTLDVAKSFGGLSHSYCTMVWKCLLCGLCVGTLTHESLQTSHPAFQWAYLTQWAIFASTLYSVLSVLNTILVLAKTKKTNDAKTTTTTIASWRIRFTWVLFELAVHLGAIVAVLYAYELFDPALHLAHLELGNAATTTTTTKIEYRPVATHGGLYLFVLFDGFCVNRIPLRWMHYLGILLPLETLYALWTYLHYVAQIGNPHVNDNNDVDEGHDNNNDDAIYPGILQWDGTTSFWSEPLVYNVMVVFVVGPVLFGLCWGTANGNLVGRDRRHYLTDFGPDHDNDDEDEEEGRPPAGSIDNVPEGANHQNTWTPDNVDTHELVVAVSLPFAYAGSVFSIWK